MHEDLLTEAARRAIEAAAIISARNGATEREPMHLLWALILEESRAAEMLKESGVSRDRLRTVSPLELGESLAANPSGDEEREITESDAFRLVITKAVQAATLRGRASQVGTDDLLSGLISVASPASQVLFQLGATPERLGLATAPISGEKAEPIGVDFDIRWRDATEEDQHDTLRIIDAAANRAREGLRVVEDYARFALDDAHLTGRLKECRHTLRDTLAGLPLEGLLRARETQTDVGTQITTQSETVRQSALDVAQAACKRVQEAVRSLEESVKVWSSVAAGRLERLRYELYTLEKALFLTEFNRRELAGRRLYLLASEALCPHGLGPAVRSALAGGVGVVQLREKEMPERRLVELGRRVRDWTREADALYIMNDRADLAVVTQADGVHLGQDDLSVKESRRIVGPHRLIGVSTHTIEQARQAVLDGADYIGVGPVFSSMTKAFESLAGLEFVRQVAAEITLPWFAIGGIHADNVNLVVEAGARRVAVSRAILSADEPEVAARALDWRAVSKEE
ncbi:MAG TPA: thiamine phosphate synthase [Planctomycetaceae bacterium]|jgi:thiamine-phosphate pyrophosphorylase|nr:thiamine phosphate synthase [Planctomycetaceae bacterium]